MRNRTGWRRTAPILVLATILAGGATVATAVSAQAAAGCQVAYTVSAQWTGGFTANIRITNLGDAINGWRLGWTFPAGQAVTQAWGFTANPASGSVLATNVDYDAVIATNASIDVGFNGSWTGSNPSPTGFTLNGTACTGSVDPTAAPTSASPTAAPTSASPTAAPSTAAPTSAPPGTGTPTVAADGTGTYRTVQAAIDAVPANNTQRVVITIKPGTYRQVITVPANKPYITLAGLGSGPSGTVLVYNDSAASNGTFASASMFVYGANFVAENLTISNDYDENNGAYQAVALHLNADRAVLRNVRLLGDQDTFLINVNARAYVVDSYVEGTVDFIFGDGTVVFNNCVLYEKRSTGGPITAARTDPAKTYGMLIYRSTITGATGNTTELGRPWGPSAQVVYRESVLSATIRTAQPWMDMSGNVWQNARFFEYKNTGAGAGVNGNRPQLTDAQAANYTPQKYLAGSDGWNPM
ncbi:pectinesterase family protein [Plantactinospora sp. KBS50]|uniref:pectinesterase family protein n=1 Tax=Plantactinospora sp. KBS50 TaxID=2024580 RepID=UPI000BAB1E83|nr:pectinesterase family protein [Plantactinospora sp. KBS50]ASW54456.1 cellulose-binding protein [Plantactinospora sp. KBS50]